ncbi:MAG: hypothetical protein PHY92_06855 [Alphaproteobacteria bacterium]|nr:hypothetical protein [Alphaproteobacteria bacterium]
MAGFYALMLVEIRNFAQRDTNNKSPLALGALAKAIVFQWDGFLPTIFALPAQIVAPVTTGQAEDLRLATHIFAQGNTRSLT